MLLFLAGLQGIPEDLYEAASIDGASETCKLWSITIPLLGPVMQMIIMLAITISLKGYESIMVLTQGGPYSKTEVMYLYPVQAAVPDFTGSADPAAARLRKCGRFCDGGYCGCGHDDLFLLFQKNEQHILCCGNRRLDIRIDGEQVSWNRKEL